MSFNIHTQSEKHFNSNSFKIVNLLDESEVEEQINSQSLMGSLSEKPSIDFSDKLADSPSILSKTTNDEIVSIYEIYKKIQIGFNEINYPIFKKFVSELYKNKSISNKVNYDFIHSCAFEWMIQTYKNKRADSDFISTLKDKIAKVTGNYKYYFKLLNLEIEERFKLGDAEFYYLDSSFFNYLKDFRTEEELRAMNEKFNGSVYIVYSLNDVEPHRGSEIALEECCKAINVLKLFSKTVYFPEIRTTFDIDSRVTVSESFENFIQDINNPIKLNINLSSGSIPIILDKKYIASIISSSKNFTSLISIKEPNELQRIILNVIEKFSEAISNKDIHRRVVDLFTIWESLLLKNDSVNIQDSLVFYGRQFLAITSDKKELFSSTIMSLYDVRSQMIHHATKKKFSIDKLRTLQLDTILLIEEFISHSFKCDTKIKLLESVDRYLKCSIEEYTKNRAQGK